MGILDEAIREHLELKRQRGATDSELQRLEDEAFGPPSRPGEPDFPEREDEAAEQSGNGVAHDGAVAEPPAAPEAPVAPPSEGEHAEAEPAAEAAEETAEEPLPGEGPQAESSSEPAAPPADEPPADEPSAELETAIYDQTVEAEPQLGDLDLEPTEEGPPPDEPPIETLDTVEHALPEQEAAPEAPPSEEPGPEPADELQPSEEEQGAASEEDETSVEGEPEDEEDVLADTPEFLKDAPEDDELWFEQGKPKDFDF
jgi:hypothetical protein